MAMAVIEVVSGRANRQRHRQVGMMVWRVAASDDGACSKVSLGWCWSLRLL
jgi:hypothetical protein